LNTLFSTLFLTTKILQSHRKIHHQLIPLTTDLCALIVFVTYKMGEAIEDNFAPELNRLSDFGITYQNFGRHEVIRKDFYTFNILISNQVL
jgi:hypothetical protein